MLRPSARRRSGVESYPIQPGFGGLPLRAWLELAALSQPCNAASDKSNTRCPASSRPSPHSACLWRLWRLWRLWPCVPGPACACFCHSSSHFRWHPDHTRRSPLYPAALASLSCAADRCMRRTLLVSPDGQPLQMLPFGSPSPGIWRERCLVLPPIGFASCWTALRR